MPDWMNWGGWRWVAILGAFWLGVWFAWTTRAIMAQADVRRYQAGAALVERLAMCTDPLAAPSQEDEVEAFAHYVRAAKSIAGDLAETDLGGHDYD